MQMFTPSTKPMSNLQSFHPFKRHKQKHSALAIHISPSIEQNETYRYQPSSLGNSKIKKIQEKQYPSSRSIIREFKLEENNQIQGLNPQTLTIKKKPLDLSVQNIQINQEDDYNENSKDNVYRQNLIKWHRKISTYKEKEKEKEERKHKEKEKETPERHSNENNHQKFQRSYLSDAIKKEFKSRSLIEGGAESRLSLRNREGERKPTQLKISNFISKYNMSSSKVQERQKFEMRNDEADKNLKEFLKAKLGTRKQRNQKDCQF